MNPINQTAMSLINPLSTSLTPVDTPPPDPQAASAFRQLLFAGSPTGEQVSALSPAEMLLQQASTLNTTVGVDLGAKIAGAVSQSVNKLANMT